MLLPRVQGAEGSVGRDRCRSCNARQKCSLVCRLGVEGAVWVRT